MQQRGEQLLLSDRLATTYPGAVIGALAMRKAANPPTHALLDKRGQELAQAVRSRFAGWDRQGLKTETRLRAYASYYRRFQKTYHVQLQLESVAFKGKSISRTGALVQAMFMAELKNLLLTAGHDLDKVVGSIVADVAEGSEAYVMFSGQEQVLKPGDMFIRDGQGVLSSVIYGPDRRTSIGSQTVRVLYTVYGPPGITSAEVQSHLEDLRGYVLTAAPEAEVEYLHVRSTR